MIKTAVKAGRNHPNMNTKKADPDQHLIKAQKVDPRRNTIETEAEAEADTEPKDHLLAKARPKGSIYTFKYIF